MNTPVRLGIVFVVALVIQLTVFVDVRIFDVAPELLALVAVVAAFFVGPERGPVIAFVAGLLWDVYLPTPLGVSAVVFAVVAYVVATLNEGLFHDTRTQLVGVVAVGSAASVIGYALLGAIVGEGGLISADLIVIALVVGASNAVLAPIAAPIMAWALAAEVDRR
ncbi:MAG TPA: rod shape-determining protein MreD [Acidimicrobiaceae bacterium]|nr:rod shape-determining protein MreD [Acidimicrobiaceae bacterium]